MKIPFFVMSIVIAGILNALSMLVSFDLGVLVGLLTSLSALAILFNSRTGWSMIPLLVFAVGITLVTWVSLTIICRVSTASICQNIFYVSLFPGFVVILTCMVILLLRK